LVSYWSRFCSAVHNAASTSEVTTLQRYRNMTIVVIIIIFSLIFLYSP